MGRKPRSRAVGRETQGLLPPERTPELFFFFDASLLRFHGGACRLHACPEGGVPLPPSRALRARDVLGAVRGARDAQPHGVRRPHADRGDARAVQRQERVERFLPRRARRRFRFRFASRRVFVRRVSPPPRNVAARRLETRPLRVSSPSRRAFRRASRRLGRRGAARRERALQEVDLERRELRLQAPGRDVFRVRGRRGHRAFRALVRDFARVDDDGHLDLARQLLEHLGRAMARIERLLHLRARGGAASPGPRPGPRQESSRAPRRR